MRYAALRAIFVLYAHSPSREQHALPLLSRPITRTLSTRRALCRSRPSKCTANTLAARLESSQSAPQRPRGPRRISAAHASRSRARAPITASHVCCTLIAPGTCALYSLCVRARCFCGVARRLGFHARDRKCRADRANQFGARGDCAARILPPQSRMLNFCRNGSLGSSCRPPVTPTGILAVRSGQPRSSPSAAARHSTQFPRTSCRARATGISVSHYRQYSVLWDFLKLGVSARVLVFGRRRGRQSVIQAARS